MRLTAAPLAWDPPAATPAQLQTASPGEASAFAKASGPAIEQLKAAGASAELLHLPENGVFGDGHGLIYEKNSDAALAPILAWLDRTLAI